MLHPCDWLVIKIEEVWEDGENLLYIITDSNGVTNAGGSFKKISIIFNNILWTLATDEPASPNLHYKPSPCFMSLAS